jgi:hypothetical protein
LNFCTTVEVCSVNVSTERTFRPINSNGRHQSGRGREKRVCMYAADVLTYVLRQFNDPLRTRANVLSFSAISSFS